MLDILIKAFGFILIIVIGFLLKSKGICKREHGQFLSTIIMNITLPVSYTHLDVYKRQIAIFSKSV